MATLEAGLRTGLRDRSESRHSNVLDRDRARKLELSMAKLRGDLINLRLIVKLIVLAALMAASVTFPDIIGLLGLI